VLVLSQYVETSLALRLVSDGSGGVGYLLKDRVDDLDEFADAVRRIAKGGSVIDPEVVDRNHGGVLELPLDPSLPQEARSRADGGGPLEPGDLRPPVPRAKTVEAHIANIFSKLELLPRPTTTAACWPSSPTCAADRVCRRRLKGLPASRRAGRRHRPSGSRAGGDRLEGRTLMRSTRGLAAALILLFTVPVAITIAVLTGGGGSR
jgi:hypothetical protein